EVSRAEQRMRGERRVGRAAEEFGVDTETLLAEYGPDVPVPVFEEAEPPTRRRRSGPASQASPVQGTLAPGGPVQQNGAGQNGSRQDGVGEHGGEPFAPGNAVSGNGVSGNGASRNGADPAATGQDEQHP